MSAISDAITERTSRNISLKSYPAFLKEALEKETGTTMTDQEWMEAHKDPEMNWVLRAATAAAHRYAEQQCDLQRHVCACIIGAKHIGNYADLQDTRNALAHAPVVEQVTD